MTWAMLMNIASTNLEGDEVPYLYSTLLDRPDLRYIGSNQRYVVRLAPTVASPG